MLIIKVAGAEVAKGFLSESDGTRETCYGFERDDGRLKESYSLCQARVDLVLTAQPSREGWLLRVAQGRGRYFSSSPFWIATYGGNELVYSAAMLRPRK